MARGQGTAGRGSTLAGIEIAADSLAVSFWTKRQAAITIEVAGELGCDPILVAPIGLLRFGGVGYLYALEQEIEHPLLVDCDDEAGLVLAGLRQGLRAFLFRGRADVLERLRCMAGTVGATVVSDIPAPLLEFAADEDRNYAIERRLRVALKT